MKKMVVRRTIAMLVSLVLMMAMIGGCGGQDKKTETAEPAVSAEASAGEAAAVPEAEAAEAGEAEAAETEAAEADAADAGEAGAGEAEVAEAGATEAEAEVAEAWTGLSDAEKQLFEVQRQVGEKFEGIFEYEGVEEKIQYEHIASEALGIEMDYPYELFERKSDEGRECFGSVYDNAEEPEYYFEVTRVAEGAEAVAAAVSEELSGEYKLFSEARVLARGGECVLIDASEAAGGGQTMDVMQQVWIIPAGEGCVVARGHHGMDSADYFGKMFRMMANSIVVK